MTTISELTKFNHKQGSITEKGLTFYVRSVDVRIAYGTVQVCIEPIGGRGRRWIDASNFTLAIQKPIVEFA